MPSSALPAVSTSKPFSSKASTSMPRKALSSSTTRILAVMRPLPGQPGPSWTHPSPDRVENPQKMDRNRSPPRAWPSDRGGA